MIVPLLTLDTAVPVGPQISPSLSKNVVSNFERCGDICVYLSVMPSVPNHHALFRLAMRPGRRGGGLVGRLVQVGLQRRRLVGRLRVHRLLRRQQP